MWGVNVEENRSVGQLNLMIKDKVWERVKFMSIFGMV